MLHHRYIDVQLGSKYASVHNYIFLQKKKVNGKINSLWTFYSNKLKKFSDSKKVELGWMPPKSQNGPICLKPT